MQDTLQNNYSLYDFHSNIIKLDKNELFIIPITNNPLIVFNKSDLILSVNQKLWIAVDNWSPFRKKTKGVFLWFGFPFVGCWSLPHDQSMVNQDLVLEEVKGGGGSGDI